MLKLNINTTFEWYEKFRAFCEMAVQNEKRMLGVFKKDVTLIDI
jgi:hypothetical protein